MKVQLNKPASPLEYCGLSQWQQLKGQFWEPLDGELALAFHWVVKIVRVIVCAIGFGLVGLYAGGYTVVFIAEVFLTDRFVDSVPNLLLLLLDAAVWLFAILGAVLGGYVGYRINRTKDK